MQHGNRFVWDGRSPQVVAQQAVANSELSIFDEWQYSERVHEVSEGDLFMRNATARVGKQGRMQCLLGCACLGRCLPSWQCC